MEVMEILYYMIHKRVLIMEHLQLMEKYKKLILVSNCTIQVNMQQEFGHQH